MLPRQHFTVEEAVDWRRHRLCVGLSANPERVWIEGHGYCLAVETSVEGEKREHGLATGSHALLGWPGRAILGHHLVLLGEAGLGLRLVQCRAAVRAVGHGRTIRRRAVELGRAFCLSVWPSLGLRRPLLRPVRVRVRVAAQVAVGEHGAPVGLGIGNHRRGRRIGRRRRHRR